MNIGRFPLAWLAAYNFIQWITWKVTHLAWYIKYLFMPALSCDLSFIALSVFPFDQGTLGACQKK